VIGLSLSYDARRASQYRQHADTSAAAPLALTLPHRGRSLIRRNLSSPRDNSVVEALPHFGNQLIGRTPLAETSTILAPHFSSSARL
jgi:hypothetical protein